ncbi:MAG: V-type ATPase subunit [Candidatus Bathyarchaeia archaeon]
MVFLPVSALLFSLVALELSAIIRKSAEEGYFAFLSPLVQSSRQQVLSESLEKLLEIEDTKNLKMLLMDAGIIDGTEQSLDDLEEVELLIAEDFGRYYNRILHYLPDDLKEFFEAYKILWDVENLKLLLCCVCDAKSPEKCVRMMRPLGFLSLKSFELLAKFRNPERAWKEALEFLPAEFLQVNFEGDWSVNNLEFSLDIAAFAYLSEKNKEIGTRKVQLVWESLIGFYEVENLVTMARLKYSKTSSKDIARFLFPSWKTLRDIDVEQLLKAEDYSAFLQILQKTSYGGHIPKEEIDPLKLEFLLKTAQQRLSFAEKQPDINVEIIIRFLVELEIQHNTIRKAAFSASIGSIEEGSR